MSRPVLAKAAAWLLRYPDDEALAAVPVVQAALAELRPTAGDGLAAAGGPRAAAAGLRAVADHRAAGEPLALQDEYVRVFDLRRRCCLYLSYYTAGDTRARGAALVAFAAAYKEAGLEVVGGELPDYLPAVLELAAADEAGWRLLREHRVGLDLLVTALSEERSVYREAVAAVRDLLPPAGPAELMAARTLARQGPPAELVGLEPFVSVDVPGGRR